MEGAGALLHGPWEYTAPIVLIPIGITVSHNPTSEDKIVLKNLVKVVMSTEENSIFKFRLELILRIHGKNKEQNVLAAQLTRLNDDQFQQLRTILRRS